MLTEIVNAVGVLHLELLACQVSMVSAAKIVTKIALFIYLM